MLMLKKALTVIALTASLLVISPAAHAQASSGWWAEVSSTIQTWWQSVIAKYRASQRDGSTSGTRGVPELDPSAAGGAVVLLVGGVIYIASRRREEEEDAL